LAVCRGKTCPFFSSLLLVLILYITFLQKKIEGVKKKREEEKEVERKEVFPHNRHPLSEEVGV